MDMANTKKLLEMLALACKEQFDFVPARVIENMHYTGTDEAGKHHFRDSFTRAYIYLTTDPLNAELVDRLDIDGKPSWTEELLAYYRMSSKQAQANEKANQ